MILCAIMELIVLMLKILVVMLPLVALFEVLKLTVESIGRKYRR